MNDTRSLSHTSYRCKYHIVILPKYRRMIIYNRLRADIGAILRQLIERKPDCRLLEAACESIATGGSSVVEGPSQQHALVVLLIPLIFISGNDTFI